MLPLFYFQIIIMYFFPECLEVDAIYGGFLFHLTLFCELSNFAFDFRPIHRIISIVLPMESPLSSLILFDLHHLYDRVKGCNGSISGYPMSSQIFHPLCNSHYPTAFYRTRFAVFFSPRSFFFEFPALFSGSFGPPGFFARFFRPLSIARGYSAKFFGSGRSVNVKHFFVPDFDVGV